MPDGMNCADAHVFCVGEGIFAPDLQELMQKEYSILHKNAMDISCYCYDLTLDFLRNRYYSIGRNESVKINR